MSEVPEERSPFRQGPYRPIGVASAMGYLLIPVAVVELCWLLVARSEFYWVGLLVFPVTLSWLIVTIVRVFKSFEE